MEEKGWDTGVDDEELFEYAMHPAQYEDYKSGKAKAAFDKDIASKKSEQEAPSAVSEPVSAPTFSSPKTLDIDVNGEKIQSVCLL